MKLLKIRTNTPQDTYIIEPLEKNILGISAQAAEHLKYLMQQENKTNNFLRVAIKGGGCSGLMLCFEFCENTKAQDIIFEKDSARVCIDPKSLGFLGGATLHVREEFGGKELILVNNPSEKQCSCGKSFSL